jgi:hypothetical protein
MVKTYWEHIRNTKIIKIQPLSPPLNFVPNGIKIERCACYIISLVQ